MAILWLLRLYYGYIMAITAITAILRLYYDAASAVHFCIYLPKQHGVQFVIWMGEFTLTIADGPLPLDTAHR